jgi:hypothetical protein
MRAFSDLKSERWRGKKEGKEGQEILLMGGVRLE